MNGFPLYEELKLRRVRAARVHAITDSPEGPDRTVLVLDADVIAVAISTGFLAAKKVEVGGWLILNDNGSYDYRPAEDFEAQHHGPMPTKEDPLSQHGAVIRKPTSSWKATPMPGKVVGLRDFEGRMFCATEAGVYVFQDEQWKPIPVAA